MIKCNGFHETCKCNDCQDAERLYNKLSSLEGDRKKNEDDIKEIVNKLESMGYSV